MTALLEDRIACFLADRPGSTVAEILRAIPCLTKTLAEILSNPLFTERDGKWRLLDADTGPPVSASSGQADGPPDSTANDEGRRAAPFTQLALTGPEFRRSEAA